MSVFGKVLAFLNILAAIAFVYLAAQARGTRHSWAYAAYRHHLVLEGLPIDDEEKDEERTPLVQKLTPGTTQLMFQGMGSPVSTLKQEVERRKGEVLDEVKKAPEILLLTARTGGERDALRQEISKAKPEELEAKVNELFREASDSSLNADTRRQAIAHLLIALAEDPDREKTESNLRRVITAVGLRNYTRAMEGHALNLREMGDRVRYATVDDRGSFLLQYENNVRQILELAQDIEDLKRHWQQLQDQRTENHEPLVAARKKDVDDLKAELAATQKTRDSALTQQTDLEKALFALQRKLGLAVERNQQLERDIRSLELGR